MTGTWEPGCAAFAIRTTPPPISMANIRSPRWPPTRPPCRAMAAGLSPAQIRAAGGGASLFSQTEGTPNIAVSLADVGLYAEDDWKLKEDMTLSYGLRYETQTGIHDHGDFGPRLGFSWAVPGGKNKPPRAVIRAGSGFFYTRFASTGLLQAQRPEWHHGAGSRGQQSRLLPRRPVPPTPVPAPRLTQNAPTIYRINPTLRAPYLMTARHRRRQSHSASIGIISANYMYSRGEHLFLTRNINAPLPGTYNPADPASGVRPLGHQRKHLRVPVRGRIGPAAPAGQWQRPRQESRLVHALPAQQDRRQYRRPDHLPLRPVRPASRLRPRGLRPPPPRLSRRIHAPARRLRINPFFIYQSSSPVQHRSRPGPQWRHPVQRPPRLRHRPVARQRRPHHLGRLRHPAHRRPEDHSRQLRQRPGLAR